MMLDLDVKLLVIIGISLGACVYCNINKSTAMNSFMTR